MEGWLVRKSISAADRAHCVAPRASSKQSCSIQLRARCRLILNRKATGSTEWMMVSFTLLMK